jgi:DNA-damage-inducible protein J
MAAKTEYIRARIEPNLKKHVHAIFCTLGVTPTQIITMFYKTIERTKEVPLDLHIPNEETARAIKEVREGKGLIYCKDVEDMFKKLDC